MDIDEETGRTETGRVEQAEACLRLGQYILEYPMARSRLLPEFFDRAHVLINEVVEYTRPARGNPDLFIEDAEAVFDMHEVLLDEFDRVNVLLRHWREGGIELVALARRVVALLHNAIDWVDKVAADDTDSEATEVDLPLHRL